MIKFLKNFLGVEAASGAVLVAVSAVAIFAANSAFAPHYEALLSPTARFFINDVLMAVFFFLIGMEIRAEINNGSLSTRKQAMLPVLVAIGGVVTPALIYYFFNAGTKNLNGWAIPSATDIAFSLGVLALFGSRLPVSLKIFLMAVAVIDDLLAVIIIAVFYTAHLSLAPMIASVACVVALHTMASNECKKIWLYLVMGVALWFFIHSSGVHSTIAGVLLGLLIPPDLGEKLVHKLHPIVAFAIIPLFAFANAGVSFTNIPSEAWHNNITIGIALGLFIGKPLGIMATAFLLVRLGFAKLPEGANWREFFAIAILAGIGFTMSLFISDLAFTEAPQMLYSKLGILLGSFASVLFGATCLMLIKKREKL